MSCKVLISFDGPASTQQFEPLAPQTPYTPDQAVVTTDAIADALTNSFRVKQTVASVEQSAPGESGGPIVRLFRRFVINHVVQQTGHSQADVTEAVAKVEVSSGRPLLDWLTSGGLQHLFQLIVQILGLIGPVA